MRLLVLVLGGVLLAPVSAQAVSGGTTTGNQGYMVSLQRTSGGGTAVDRHFCGGVLVAAWWVLTAAHCVAGKAPADVDLLIGRAVLTDTSQGEKRDAAAIVPYPQADVALIRLAAESFRFPIHLTSPVDAGFHQHGDPAVVRGWGASVPNGPSVDQLRQAAVGVRSDAQMSAIYGAAYQPASMIGAGSITTGAGTCTRDDGGPLIVDNFDIKLLAGIAIWTDGCGANLKPGVFADLTGGPAREFVERTIKRPGGGYAHADQPTAAAYEPAVQRYTRARHRVLRHGVGVYEVRFGDLGWTTTGGMPQVTPVGSSNHYCNVDNWYPSGPEQVVGVRCFNAGQPADSAFDVMYLRGSKDVRGPAQFAYLWAGSPTAAQYDPDPVYSFNASGLTNSVQRLATGRYRVTLPGLLTADGFAKANAETSQGTDRSVDCNTAGWFPAAQAQIVDVRCVDHLGHPVDAAFDLTFLQNDPGATILWWADVAHVQNLQFLNPDYVPGPAEITYNSFPGAVNRVVRLSTGRYRVHFGGFGPPASVSVQVSTWQALDHRCKAGGWTQQNGAIVVDVQCNTLAGVPLDATFVALVAD